MDYFPSAGGANPGAPEPRVKHAMPSLSFYDYAFLVTETADSPKHVAGLQIFRPPPDYDGDYVADLVAALRRRPPGPLQHRE